MLVETGGKQVMVVIILCLQNGRCWQALVVIIEVEVVVGGSLREEGTVIMAICSLCVNNTSQ